MPFPVAWPIAGILHVGAQLARARSGRSFHSPPAPFALVIEVREPGELHISRWTAVDGAVVLGSDLRVLGFGAEIVLDAAAPVRACEVCEGEDPARTRPRVDSESFGMRHRSALRCVAVAAHAAAFVVSQDGDVSFFWKQSGQVFLKRNVNTANPNMVGG